MRNTRWLIAAAVAVATFGMGVLASTPVTSSIEPSSGSIDRDVPVVLTGHDFEPGMGIALLAGGGHRSMHLSTPGVVSIAVAGEHAFAATYTSLLTFDVSTPAAPHLVGALPIGGWPGYLRAADQRVFAAVSGTGGYARIRIFDSRDPLLPIQVGEIPADVPWAQFGYADGYLYLPRARYGFDVVDVRDAAHPLTVARYRDPGFRVEAIEVIGPLAYAAGTMSTSDGAAYPIVQILDVSSPANPRLRAVGDLPGTIGRFAPTTVGVLLTNSKGLAAINYQGTFLANVRMVRQGGSVPSFITTNGNCAAYFNGVIEMLDVTDPFSPVVRGRFPVAQQFAQYGSPLAFLGGFAYWGLDSGLSVYDACEPFAASPLHERSHRWGLKDVAFSDDRVHFIDDLGQLHVTGLDDPSNPQGFGVTNDLPLADRVAVSADLAFVGGQTWSWYDRGVLSVVDESVIGVMPVIGSTSLVGPPAAIDAEGDRVFVGGWSELWGGSLEVVDVSRPAEPWVAGRLEGLARPWTITAAEGALYYFSDWTLTIVDASDPDRPAIAGTHTGFGWPTDSARAGHLLFVTEMVPWTYDRGTLKVLDISLPLAPAIVAEVPIEGLPLGIDADDARVVVTTESAGVLVYDLALGLPPRLVQSIADSGRWVGLFDGFVSVHRGGTWTNYQLNPPLEGSCSTSGECAQSIIPAGVARGLYDVSTTCPHGHASRFRDAYRACTPYELTSHLEALVEQGPPLRWQLTVEGEDQFFAPGASRTAHLLLPALPESLETRYATNGQPNLYRIELQLTQSMDAGVVRLIGDDRALLDGLWAEIRTAGGIALTALDSHRYGDFKLSTSEQGGLLNGRPSFRYSFTFYGTRLDSAYAGGPGADLLFSVTGADDILCTTDAPTRYSDGLREACEEWGASHSGLLPGCLW